MKIHEYQAKNLFRKNGITVLDGIACFSVKEAVEAAKGGGTYITETVAPVACFASLTVAKIGIFSKCSPGLFGFTPATKQFFPFAYSMHDFV